MSKNAPLQHELGPRLCETDAQRSYDRDGVRIYHGDVLELYASWSSPTTIVSDGAYGLGLFPGDPCDVTGLADWYRPHVESWSQLSTPRTTLWFWNSEIGWATLHPLLESLGWTYVRCCIWDKGMAHIAGNSNTQRLRQFPCVSEICVQYIREARVRGLTLKDWLRQEWERTSLPLSLTNEACGVRNAATRKYFTKDHLWYFPPPDMFEKLAEYANVHGKPQGRPYFSLDGQYPVTAKEWSGMRAVFHCRHGITNVWHEPPVNGSERLKSGGKSLHLNQKPLALIEVTILASSDEGDMIWEPFGGLCTAALAAYHLRRRCASAEVQEEFYKLATRRLRNAQRPSTSNAARTP